MEGLDITVLKLSEVSEDNDKLRIDDGYFSKVAVQTQHRIETLPHIRLGELCDIFRKGIFDIKASSYAETGIPFVRISNLNDGLVDLKDVAFITPAAHQLENKTALEFGDIVLSKTAYAAASFVNVPKCNVSQDTIAVKLSKSGSKRVKSGFVVAYLNSRYGLALMERQFQGNVQAHLSLPDGRRVPIPLFSNALQTQIDNSIREADKLLIIADKKTEEAESTLTEALGLDKWVAPDPLTYTRPASEAFAAGRLDAEFFRDKFVAARKKLEKMGAIEFISLEELTDTLTNGHTPLHHDLTQGEVPFLCAEHVTDFECDYNSKKRILLSQHQGELARTNITNGDVLLTIKGRVGNFAIAEDVPGPVNINQDVALLRLNNRLPKWWVMAFLNCRFGKYQVEQLCTGGINPFLGLSNVRKLAVPRFANDVMKSIAGETLSKVHEARKARARAHLLLKASRRAVEIAIESSEAVALKYLKEI